MINDEIYNIFNYLDVRKRLGNKELEKSYLQSYYNIKNENKIKKILKKIIDSTLNSYLKKDKYDIIFVGNRFNNLISRMSNLYNILVIGSIVMKDRLNYFNLRIPYKSPNKWFQELCKVYEEGLKNEIEILSITNEITQFLKKTDPKVIILHCDSLFLERAIIYSARNLKIKTITIQDGLFQFKQPEVNHGYFSDYFLCWGNYFKKMYIENKIKNENDIFVLGYPYSNKSSLKIKPNSINIVHTVYFFGQPYENYNENLLQVKIDIVNNIIRACEEYNMNLVYRVHPSEKYEDIERLFPDIKRISKDVPLMEDIKRCDIAFSINSTALVETALSGKIAVEIKTPEIIPYDYDKVGACFSINNDYKEICGFIENVKNNKLTRFEVNDEYIHTSENIYKDFENILKEISY